MSKITQKTVEKVKQAAKEQTIKENAISEEEAKILEEALAAAKMPVHLTDEEFKLGDYELDIRDLSDKNKAQMIFRSLTLNVVYLRSMNQTLVDMMRLIMLVLKNQGTIDIVKETESLMEELAKKTKQN